MSAIFGFTRGPENLTPDIYRAHWYKPTGGLLQILPSDWLSYSLYIGDRPLVAKGIDFQIKNNGRKLAFFRVGLY